jgi:phage protein U
LILVTKTDDVAKTDDDVVGGEYRCAGRNETSRKSLNPGGDVSRISWILKLKRVSENLRKFSLSDWQFTY